MRHGLRTGSGLLLPAQVARVDLAALTAGDRIGILHRDVKPANILLAPGASGEPHARVLREYATLAALLGEERTPPVRAGSRRRC